MVYTAIKSCKKGPMKKYIALTVVAIASQADIDFCRRTDGVFEASYSSTATTAA